MRRLFAWADRHHHAISSLSALGTLIFAIAAIGGTYWQIESSRQLQQQQSARDIYREYLNLSANKPEFSQPDYCALQASPQFAAYESYVAYLLYAGEQTVALGADWTNVIRGELERHTAYLCSANYEPDDYEESVADLVSALQRDSCAAITPCSAQ